MADTFKGIITADGKKRQLPYRNVIETPVFDETLSIQGAFADSKAVGDKFKKFTKGRFIQQNRQILRKFTRRNSSCRF